MCDALNENVELIIPYSDIQYSKNKIKNIILNQILKFHQYLKKKN